MYTECASHQYASKPVYPRQISALVLYLPNKVILILSRHQSDAEKLAEQRWERKEGGGDTITDVCWILSGAWTFRNSIINENEKCYPDFLSVSVSFISTAPPPPKIPQTLDFTPTHQDSGDYVGSVLQAVSLIAASHEAGGGHILLIFVPVADLRQGQLVTLQGLYLLNC